MEFSECFPVWDQLDPRQRELVLTGLVSRRVKKGTPLHGGGDCLYSLQGGTGDHPLPAL